MSTKAVTHLLPPDLHPAGFSRLPAVLALIPISRSSWWEGVQAGRFPSPVKMGRSSLWRNSDLLALVDRIAKGGST
jgi:predicted DNA-binding transcriptional regulator AlpA